MNKQQLHALRKLNYALQFASETGLLDKILIEEDHPTINKFAELVQDAAKESVTHYQHPHRTSEQVLFAKAPRTKMAKEIKILGHRDPRGPDNSVFVWVDAQDQLHIKVWKADRCYKFKEVVEGDNYVEIVAD